VIGERRSTSCRKIARWKEVVALGGPLPGGLQGNSAPSLLEHQDQPLFLELREPGLRFLVERQGWPQMRPPIPDVQLVRMNVALRMAVEQPHEECPPGPLRLADQGERLLDRHDALAAQPQ
jgi:hypothetical protein